MRSDIPKEVVDSLVKALRKACKEKMGETVITEEFIKSVQASCDRALAYYRSKAGHHLISRIRPDPNNPDALLWDIFEEPRIEVTFLLGPEEEEED